MKVLVINCGSSSLKYQLIDMSNENVLAQGLVERIGIDGILTQKVEGREKWLGKTYERRRNQRVSRQNQAEASRRKRKMVGKDLRKR